MDIVTYECLECGWIGLESEMQSDSQETDDGEAWSNWICPKCHTWWNLDDYVQVIEDAADFIKESK